MAETKQLLCFSTADRRRTCPYPRSVRTDGICRPHFRFDFAQALQALGTACVGMIEGLILVEFLPEAESVILSAMEVERKAVGAQMSSSPRSLGSRPHANRISGSTLELVRNIVHLHF